MLVEQPQSEDVHVRAQRRVIGLLLFKRNLLPIGRKIPPIRLAQRKWRHIVRVARIEIPKFPILQRHEKQMAPLVPGKRVPVPIQQLRKNPRLHFALRLGIIPLLVARVLVGAWPPPGAAIRIHRRRKQNVFPIRRPSRVIRLGADVRQLPWLAHRARRCIKGSQPDLLTLFPRSQKRNLLSIRRKTSPVLARQRSRQSLLLAARHWHNPQM
jgi:hypothetical protein